MRSLIRERLEKQGLGIPVVRVKRDPHAKRGRYNTQRRLSGLDHPDFAAQARLGTSALYGDGTYPEFESEVRGSRVHRPLDHPAPPLRNWPTPRIGGPAQSYFFRFTYQERAQ